MNMFRTLREDIKAVIRNDPAFPGGLVGLLEVLLCYPGFHAIELHRFNHFLHARLRIPVLPRILSNVVRWLTGIEIHPGATLGRGVFIDHGMGVVIGETAVVGDNVTMYHGVTLGGTGKEKGKRHPTVESGAFLGSGARILGNVTIGRNARIGAGSVVVRDVPGDSTVVGVPGRVVRTAGKRAVSPRSPEEIVKRLELLEREMVSLRRELSKMDIRFANREVA